MTENKVKSEEIKKWLELLRSKASEDRLRAATELRSIVVRMRGAVRTRGSLTSPASSEVPKEIDYLGPAIDALKDQKREVRQEVASALGELGDELAVDVLERLAKQEPEWEVRTVVADSLAKIGGTKAVDILKYMATIDPHPNVRARAVDGLGNLAIATWPTDRFPLTTPTRGAVRTRGRIRIRGASPSKRISPEADAILRLLDEIRFKDSSQKVREIADSTLASLDE